MPRGEGRSAILLEDQGAAYPMLDGKRERISFKGRKPRIYELENRRNRRQHFHSQRSICHNVKNATSQLTWDPPTNPASDGRWRGKKCRKSVAANRLSHA